MMTRDEAIKIWRNRILSAMDNAMRDIANDNHVLGATDQDLPALFEVLDDQFDRAAARQAMVFPEAKEDTTTIKEAAMFHTPDSWDELHGWLEMHDEASRPHVMTAAMMAWNLAAKITGEK